MTERLIASSIVTGVEMQSGFPDTMVSDRVGLVLRDPTGDIRKAIKAALDRGEVVIARAVTKEEGNEY